MKLINVKLNDKYTNDFLTTTSGLIFYRKDNSLDREETIREVDLNNIEHAQLLSQGTFVIVEDKPMQTVKTIKEDIPKKTLDNSLKIEKEGNPDSDKSDEELNDKVKK